MIRCFSDKYVKNQYRKRGKEYAGHMESARVEDRGDKQCYDDSHPGWKLAADTVKEEAGPGQVLHKLIKLMTGEAPIPGCSCNDRIRLMNAWGYKECISNRKLIMSWMATEAKKRGYTIDKSTLRGLVMSLFKGKKS